MALVAATLETALKAIFAAMNTMSSGGDDYCAEQTALAIKAFILTGQAATVDSGAAPAGAYVGSGAGTMAIDADALKSALKSTFDAAYDNDGLAARMADDIDNACKADNTVSTTSTGTVTTSSGATAPFSGPGHGKFSGSKSAIETALQSCFSAMNNMGSGGNDYFAAALASAIDSYLKAGTVSVALQAPFVSGSGSGAMA
jgi:hypothetical protein